MGNNSNGEQGKFPAYSNMGMSKKSTPKSDLACSFWQKEIQRCISFSAYETVFGMKQMSKESQDEKMYELYHGTPDPNNVSYVTLCIEGKNQFAHLWDNVGQNTMKLRMKQSFIRCARTTLVVNESITGEFLSRVKLNSESGSLLKGRTVRTQAQLALLNTKKAFAYALGFLQGPPEYEYPSGQNEDDLDTIVMEKMYADEYGVEAEFDKEWIFPGWLAFKCFGLKAPKTFRSTLMTLTDVQKDASRRDARAECQKEKDGKRDLENGSRGIPLRATRKDLAVMAQKEMDLQKQEKETTVVVYTSMISSNRRKCNLP